MIQMLADGYRYPEIGQVFGLTEDTVKKYIKRLFDLSGSETAAQLVAKGFRTGKLK